MHWYIKIFKLITVKQFREILCHLFNISNVMGLNILGNIQDLSSFLFVVSRHMLWREIYVILVVCMTFYNIVISSYLIYRCLNACLSLHYVLVMAGCPRSSWIKDGKSLSGSTVKPIQSKTRKSGQKISYSISF